MPKRARIDFAELAKATEVFDPSEAQRELRMLTVAESTIKQYRSAVAGVTRFATCIGQRNVSKDIFIRFAAGLQRTGRGGVDTLKQTLSAIRFLQHAEGLWAQEGMWADDEDLDTIVAGVCYNGKHSRRSTTGAITREMLLSLTKRCALMKRESLIPAYQIAHAANLRVKQTATLKTDALVEDEKGSFLIRVDKDKRVREKSRKKDERHLKDITPEGAAIFKRIVKNRPKAKGDEVYLFDQREWKYTDLNSFLKESASALGWPSGLEWGFHSLRHGQVADQLLVNTLTRHRTQVQDLKRYGQTNKKRTSK
jgi:hypothetical protein